MLKPSFAVWITFIASLAALIIFVLTYFQMTRNPEDQGRPGGLNYFRDSAHDSGLAFRMSLLASAQGEDFQINLYDHGCGVVVGDFDADGFDDVYFLNQTGRNALFRNKGDGTFEDVTLKAGVGLGDRVCVGATFADYDNSGRQSLYVTSTRGGNVLFRNLGDGTFKDVTKEAGLTHVGHSQTATFFDYDNDGYLDLLVTNTARWTIGKRAPGDRHFLGLKTLEELIDCPKEQNILYHNNRDGTFTNVTAKAGLAGKGWGGDVAVFDCNGDGFLDVLVTSMFGITQLYKNNGDGTFTDVTKEVLGRTPFGAIGCKVFDFNNDGRLDLLIVDMHSDMWLPPTRDPRLLAPEDLRRKYPTRRGLYDSPTPETIATDRHWRDALKFSDEDVVYGNSLYQKLPSGEFAEVSDKANMETFWPWGIATGDFDNDGYEDVFLPSGMGYPFAYWPNALMMNNGNGTFTDKAKVIGIEPPPGGEFQEQAIGDKMAVRSSRCAAVADFDHSGRLSLVVNNFNDRPYYFRNQFPQKNWIAFRLEGTRSNRDAIGALVTIHCGKEVMVRQVQGAGGYLSQSSKTIHFGLGERARVDQVEILWPTGGRRQPQVIDNPPINMLHPVKEDAVLNK